MISQILINFFVSVSMKKMLTAVKIIQIIAFFVLIDINYTPVSDVFLQALF